jgi:hypothetical protein
MKTLFKILVVPVAWLLAGLPVWADLVATVQPGYTFSAGEFPTTATLNELGQPTITISGTVSGSTGLTAGSVTGTLLADSVPDGIYLSYNASVPRQMTLLNGGAALAGDGVASFSNTNLTLYFDTNYFQLATNSPVLTNSTTGSTKKWLTFTAPIANILTPPTNTVFGNGTNGTAGPVFLSPQFTITQQTNVLNGVTNAGQTLALQQMIVTNIPLSSYGTNVQVTNSLGVVPGWVRLVAVQTNSTAQQGYYQNDEVEASAFQATVGGPATFAVSVNITNITIAQDTVGNPYIIPKTGGTYVQITASNWKLKLYVRP